MLIGVLADTHDNLPMIERAREALRERGVELLVHAGDFVSPFALKLLLKGGLPLIGVFGNNDGEKKGLRKLDAQIFDGPHRFELAGRRILVAHEPDVLQGAIEAGDDLAVCAHTHRSRISAGSPLTVNPGEASGWLYGLATVAVVNLEEMSAKIVKIGRQERPEI